MCACELGKEGVITVRTFGAQSGGSGKSLTEPNFTDAQRFAMCFHCRCCCCFFVDFVSSLCVDDRCPAKYHKRASDQRILRGRMRGLWYVFSDESFCTKSLRRVRV